MEKRTIKNKPCSIIISRSNHNRVAETYLLPKDVVIVASKYLGQDNFILTNKDNNNLELSLSLKEKFYELY